jgi:hypothetical protein
MMKSHNILIISLILLGGSLTASCSDDGGGGGVKGEEQTVSNASEGTDHWVYYSLEDGKTVGVSRFGDTQADNAWAQRTDWDIAVSGDLIRTNSGRSGSGKGGIIELSGDYDTYNGDPETLVYTTDTYE